jgi:hypothetical protein
MSSRRSRTVSKKSSPRKSLASLSKIFDVTASPASSTNVFGKGIGSAISGVLGITLSLAISIVALVLISLVYSQVQTVESDKTTYVLAALSLGVVAIGLQILGAVPALGIFGRLVNLVVMVAYISAGVLALLFAASTTPDSTLQTYALVAGIFYIFIGGAFVKEPILGA